MSIQRNSKSISRTAVGRRLREFRKTTLRLKAFELANQLKLSQGSLSDIENGKSFPAAPTLAALHKHTGVNIVWLLTGEGGVLDSPPAETPEVENGFLPTIQVSACDGRVYGVKIPVEFLDVVRGRA